MRRRELLAAPGALVLAAAGEKPAPSAPNTNTDNRLDGILRPYLAQYGLPAVAAAVARDGRLVAGGAVGTRRIGSDIPVTINDRFHIGSDTKAMTALLAAMLVEAGKLRWDATVGAIFPELVATMAAGVAGITLEQLLSHTSGISSDNPAQDKLIEQSFAQPGNLDELRYWIVTGLVKKSLQSKPGEKFAYSNLGYTLAGAIIERVGGKSWEELIAERIFDPLGLKSWIWTTIEPRPGRRSTGPPDIAERNAESDARRSQRRQPRSDRTRRHRASIGARFRHLGGLADRLGQARPGADSSGNLRQAARWASKCR